MAITGYLIVVYQDINPSSPTFNQTREERTQSEEFCPTSAEAHWIEDTTYCELTENGMLTGYEITVYRDVEPLSPTYDQTREERELNLEECEADNTNPNWQNIGDPFCRQVAYMPSGILGNDGYMIQEQQDVNEYSPTAEEIREIETLDLEHCPLPNTLPDWEVIYEACHIIKVNGQLVFDGTKDVVRIDRNQYSPTWNDNVPETVNIEDTVNCPPDAYVQYRWVVVAGQYVCVGYDKHTMEKKQKSTDGGTTWTDVVPSETRAGALIEANSEDCGYVPTIEYRWVVITGQYECVGYDKYSVEKKQQRIDGGPWTDVVPSETRTGSLIEHNSEDCGYVPPIDYSAMYFTLEAIEDGTFTFTGTNNNSLSYTLDEGQTWIPLASGVASPTVTSGNKIMWKGACTPDTTSQLTIQYGIGTFSSTGTFKTYGNAMSLVYEDNFINQTTMSDWQFARLFSQTKVTDAQNLILPSTTLTNNCYTNMFWNCTSLVNAPALPATTLAEHCYNMMFHNCSSLVNAPALPATTLADWCYESMFWNCTSLVNAPALSATTLARGCYNHMFEGCTSLTTAPQLPATTLAISCYNGMFAFCTNLMASPTLPATTLADGCYSMMFSQTNVLPDCTNIDFTSQTVVANGGLKGLFFGTKVTDADLQRILPKDGNNRYCLPVMTLVSGCYSEMFSNCTSLTTAPVLPATVMASSCYNRMFYDCESLTSAPVLPATTLAQSCYQNMFEYCTRLNSITCLATDISAYRCTFNWVNGVANSGTFTKAASMSDWTTGINGIPNGWTVTNQ